MSKPARDSFYPVPFYRAILIVYSNRFARFPPLKNDILASQILRFLYSCNSFLKAQLILWVFLAHFYNKIQAIRENLGYKVLLLFSKVGYPFAYLNYVKAHFPRRPYHFCSFSLRS